MNERRSRQAAIVGIHEYPSRVCTGESALQIKGQSAVAALKDAGLTVGDVDALYDCGEHGHHGVLHMAEYLGLDPAVVGGTNVGGSSFEIFVADAYRAIANGDANVALVTYAERPRSSGATVTAGGPLAVPRPVENMEMPWGINVVSNYALVAARHCAQYGTTPEQLAEIAVVTRRHAMRNPMAVDGLRQIGMRKIGEIGIDDVLSSPMIAEPLHLLDCCLVTDGGGAIVLAAPAVVAGSRHRPIWIAGSGMATAYPTNGGDMTISAAARSGPRALQQAGIGADDVDVAMLYDSFTITVLMALEDIGFCKKGEGGSFVEGGRLAFDGEGPALNTDGGGLSSTHPGMRGLFLLMEAVRQLRGESTSQVSGASTALVHGNGVLLGTRHVGATVVLEGD